TVSANVTGEEPKRRIVQIDAHCRRCRLPVVAELERLLRARERVCCRDDRYLLVQRPLVGLREVALRRKRVARAVAPGKEHLRRVQIPAVGGGEQLAGLRGLAATDQLVQLVLNAADLFRDIDQLSLVGWCRVVSKRRRRTEQADRTGRQKYS